MPILHQADASVVAAARSYIKRVRIRIDHRPLRGRFRCYHPFTACDLGFEEAISQYRYYRDRIEDEDQQDHGVDQVDVELVKGDGDHQLETDPVEQGQDPGQFCIPWAPEPVGSARRDMGCLDAVHLQLAGFVCGNHGQNLSGSSSSICCRERESRSGRNASKRLSWKPERSCAIHDRTSLFSSLPLFLRPFSAEGLITLAGLPWLEQPHDEASSYPEVGTRG